MDPHPEAPAGSARADVTAFRLRTTWLLLLTAAGSLGLVAEAGWAPELDVWAIALATASIPVIVAWAHRVLADT